MVGRGCERVNVLSLFDGISCGQVALQRAGIPVTRYLASEIDKHPITVTQHNWPATVQLGDVVKVREMAQIGLLPAIDLLMGGSPCQGFSNAGKGEGFADPRSRLFFEYVRIKALLKPRWFLLENVKMKKADMDMISWWLGVEPVFINSADFSAQNRQRYYWTNIPVAPWQDRGIMLCDVLELKNASRQPEWIFVSTHSKNGLKQVGYYSVGAQGHRLYCSSGKHPTLCTNRTGGAVLPFIWHNGEIGKINKKTMLRLQTLPDDYMGDLAETTYYNCVGNGWTVDVIAHILKGIVQ